MKKSIKELVDKMKYKCTLPDNWNKYLYEIEKKNNLIIKNKNTYYCTNCQQSFTYLNKGPELKSLAICPHCKNEYFVRSSRLKNWKKHSNILLLDNIDGQLIVRIFEMESIYNREKQEMEHDTVEYSRKIVDEDFREIRNERVSIAQCGPFVLHWKEEEGEWRVYDGYWYESMAHGYLYRDNIQAALKGTIYEKSRLWEYAKKYKNKYIDLKELLCAAKYESFETLVEMKLYKLAEASRYFVCKGTFKQIFGVDKTYYQFMKKYNITKSELKILQIYSIKDIRTVKFLERYEHVLEDIKKYTTIDNFIKYFRKKRLKDAILYRDYLNFAQQLGFNLKDKKYLFPDKLKLMHDKYENQIKILKQKQVIEDIAKRFEILNKNTFENKEFIIFPAISIESLFEESKQQNNCVKTYAEKYANGECDIYFMRKIANPKQSLVTVEVKNNKVIQKRTKNNDKTNTKQDKFLKMWQEKVLERKAS